MHPVRRRKKRPNYGVRTVEVARGKNGFGFTISGQQPCILSCIVGGSPAEKAGLRPGDYLVAVNGQSVSKLLHDDVVRLIGNLDGILKLQIAENYYSDSSDEDNIPTVRSKPKFIHKPRSSNTSHHSNGCQTNKTAKVVRDLRANTIYNKFAIDGASYPSHSTFHHSWDLPELPPLRVSNVKNSQDGKEELSFVIGYLGTIEMPKQIQPGFRPQVVRGCIKRLRTEKRSHSWVLMRVHADGVTVASNGGKILAEYPVSRITYCGTSSEDDKKYFGLVTIATGDGNDVLPSSSCHVFAVQANLFQHEKHSAKAASLKVTCTSGTLSQGCLEFPSTSEPILNAIRSFCLTKDEGNGGGAQNEMVLANSPQPSHSGSTAASSNSDSGIGFRDECGNQSDRIVMVDVENQRLHIQQLYNSSKGLENSLNIQLQDPNEEILETPTNLHHAFARVCPLPVSLNSVYGSCSTDQGRPLPKSKVPTSNRSRSPLLSSSPSSSDGENNKTLTKMTHLKNVTVKSKPGRSTCANNYENEDSSKSLPPPGSWCEKSIFYQLGLLSNQSLFCGRSKDGQNLSYKATSKSSENLDDCIYYNQKGDSNYGNIACNKLNSKSTDNLVQMDLYGKDYNKLSPQVNISKCTTGGKSQSPLSISYGEGSIIHASGEQKTRSRDEKHDGTSSFASDRPGDTLLSYSSSPKRLFGQTSSELGRSGQTLSFKSADDMSICSYKSNDALLTYKLSPKVFGIQRPLATQSLEDLKGSDGTRHLSDQSLDPSKLTQWGSLQDLRNFDTRSFEASLMPKDSGFEEKETNEKTKGPVSWANSFEKLLEDPAGLNAFSEFLKKEFSQENITFWVSCEKYKSLEDESERKKLAEEIFETHLGTRAMEPVNIDAQANQHAQEKLAEAPIDLFVPAQKQIFNLMKFDSYPRFIKSDLYKECLLRDLENEDMENMDKTVANGTPNGRGKLKKSRSDAEDSSRKSLLPWNKKNRSKSKDRGESEYKLSMVEPVGKADNNEDVVSVRSEITSSRSSLASWDLALRGSFSRQSITSGEASERENCQLCRVLLSNGATTVVRVRPKETVRELIHRLLEKRGLHYGSFDLFVTGSSKPLSLDEKASSLSNKEIKVEQRIVFRLDLPNKRTVSVKAKPSKTLGQVLRSVLHKYSYRLEAVAVCSMSENEVLEMSLPVTSVDGRKLTVLTRSTDAWKTENGSGGHVTSHKTFVKPGPTLDEITNKVFEEVLQGKSDAGSEGKCDQGSLKSEEWGSEHSSGVFSKFLRRDSTYHEKSKGKIRGGTSRQIFEGATKHVEDVVSMVTGKPPLIGKWKSGKLGGKSDGDDLYEELKRAQRNRLEDQRGTEINIELPDFLKDKENAPVSGKKSRIFKSDDGATTPKFYDMEPIPIVEGSQETGSTPAPKSSFRAEKLSSAGNMKSSTESTKFDLSTTSGLRKSDQAGRTISKPLTCKTYETPKTTPIKSSLTTDSSRKSGFSDGRDSRILTPGKSEPPPLPPKPKYLPSKSVPWNLNNLNASSRGPQEITNRGSNFPKPSDIKRDNKLARSRRTVYLDQPSSSFV